MKIFFSLLTLLIFLNENVECAVNGLPIIVRFTPEAVIHQLSELIRYLIRSGDISKGVPVLDPYEFEWRHREFAGHFFNAKLNITNGNLIGLGNFKHQQFNFSKSEISIEVDLHIPSLKFYSDYYELDGNIYEAVPIKGQGTADIEAHNILLRGKLYLKQSADGKAILLDKIENPQFNIERIVSRTQFDDNIDGVISAMVEELLADYLNRFNKYIAASYTDSIVLHLNPTLEKFDSWNMIAVLLSNFNK